METIENGGHGGFEGPKPNVCLKVFFDHYLRGADSKPEFGTLQVRE
jgi:hypothetical protein